MRIPIAAIVGLLLALPFGVHSLGGLNGASPVEAQLSAREDASGAGWEAPAAAGEDNLEDNLGDPESLPIAPPGAEAPALPSLDDARGEGDDAGRDEPAQHTLVPASAGAQPLRPENVAPDRRFEAFDVEDSTTGFSEEGEGSDVR